MNDFKVAPTSLLGPDPFKRVKYELGLVLGKDELEQEQYYFVEQDRLHNRVLHGYGTVCGLKVDVKEAQVVVAAGLAIDPKGRIIRVDVDRCRDVNEWLAEYKQSLSEMSPPSIPPDRLYLVLCYQECPTDKAPVPGAACRPREESLAFSRTTESFELMLVTEPPPQTQEEIIREFGNLFAEFRISIGAPPLGDKLPAAKDQLAERVRGLDEVTSPPALSSPPDDHLTEVNPVDAEILLRHALRVWLTEVKPKLLPGGRCARNRKQLPGDECVKPSHDRDDVCVLLAELNLNVDPTTWQVGNTDDIVINEETRPILLSTRVLQEYLLNRFQAELLGADGDHTHPQYLDQAQADALYSPLVHVHRLDNLSDVTTPAPSNNDVLIHQGATWTAGRVSHADLADLHQDQHTQYLRADGSRPLELDWDVGNKKVTGLAVAEDAADALSLGQAENQFVQALGSPYAVVAAGRFDSKGNPKGDTYNKLTAKPVDPRNQPGVFDLHWSAYANPDTRTSGHSYIVKGSGEGGNAIFHVMKFGSRNTGIRIRIQGDVGPSPGTLPDFMVEISVFGKF